MKKLITILIAVCMVFALLPFGAFAAEYTCRDTKELEKVCEQCKESCDEAQRNVDGCQSVYDSAADQIAADQEKVNSIKDSITENQQQVKLLSAAIDNANQARSDYEAAKEEYDSIPFFNLASKRTAENKMKNAKSKYEESLCGYKSIADMQVALNAAEQALSENQNKLSEAEKHFASDQQTLNSVKISLDAAKVQLSIMKAEQKAAEKRLESAKATHNTQIRNIVEATCTEEGYTGDSMCLDCGQTIEKGKTVEPLGHFYKNGICIRCGARAEGNPFVDVKEGSYYCEPVLWAYEHNPQIACGMDSTHFQPDTGCTRAHIVTFLWRAMGCPEPSNTSSKFVDIVSNEFYYKAVLWAVEMGITEGIDSTHFAPNVTCTRAHAVTFLWRMNKSTIEIDAKCPFVDVSSTEYYYQATVWAVKKEITNGVDATHFQPNATCTRGQIVTFLYRSMK